MNPNTATNEELRDWLANHQPMLPIPNTIDAAAKCLPEWWAWYCTEIEWKAHPIPTISATNTVSVARTSEESTDRFRLAVKAIMAMEECK